MINSMMSQFVVGAGWEGFRQTLVDFFQNGLGGPGAEGLGISIMVLGVVLAVVSYFLHKTNRQTQMPGPFTWIMVGLAGSFLTMGMSKPIELFNMTRDWIMSLIGL